MSVLDHARIIIYRVNKKGLEVFLLKAEDEGDDKWHIPEAIVKQRKSNRFDEIIELEPIENMQGDMQPVVAMEADWHEIPSVRAIIKEDVRIVKDTIKTLEKGSYVAVKECIKNLMPDEYAMVKELKDILIDRNQAKYI